MLGLRPVRVCDDCLQQAASLANAPETLCSRCGDALGMESMRFAGSMGARECTACDVTPPAFERAVAFGSFDKEMRELLHAFKYDGMRRLAQHGLGAWLAKAIAQLEAEAARDLLVVPVPLFPARERQRGFNQSDLLARAAIEQLAKSHRGWKLELRPGALARVRDTRPQYALAPGQRQRNLKGAFRASEPDRVRGREVLLVDDIFTTGATANVCARVLLRAGATRVWVATVARAQPENLKAVQQTVARWDAPIQASSVAVLRE